MVECKNCGIPHIKPNEKKTDVNIATAMLVDMFEKRCEMQILVSGDSDYENTLKELRRLFPKEDLIVAFPPRRRNNKLIGNDRCTMSFDIQENAFRDSQFSNTISYKTKTGKVIKVTKPTSWT
jgi:hypothetical protein